MKQETRGQRHRPGTPAALLLAVTVALGAFSAAAQTAPVVEQRATVITSGKIRAVGQSTDVSAEEPVDADAPAGESSGAAETTADEDKVDAGTAEQRLEQLAATRKVVEEYSKTRREISQERSQWRRGRELLEGRIAMLDSDITTLTDKTRQVREEIKGRQQTLDEEEQKNKAGKDAADGLVATLEDLERRTSALLVRLPAPLRERVGPLVERLPEDATKTELTLLQRFQTVLGILKEVNRFNSEVTVSEMRTQHDGKDVLVTALFVGLGHGYYVSPGGDIASVGRASADGWIWTPANEAAPQIARIIAIWQKKELPAFVEVPVDVNSSVKEDKP